MPGSDPPFLAGGGIQQSDRAGGQVTTIFIGLSGAIQQADFQGIEITGMDKSLSSDYQTVLIGDRLRDAAVPLELWVMSSPTSPSPAVAASISFRPHRSA